MGGELTYNCVRSFMCRRLTPYLVVSLLTFALGVLAAFLLVGHRIYSTPYSVTGGNVITPFSEAEVAERERKKWEDYFGAPLVWTLLVNDEKQGQIAVVRADADAPNGKVRAKLKLNCPSTHGSIEILAGDTERTGLDLKGYNGGSYLPEPQKNIVEVRTISEGREISFRTKARGNIRYENPLAGPILSFELTETHGLERMIARGGTEVTFIIHDVRKNDNKLSVTFPEIDSASQMAEDLNGCRASKKR
jgi:hypothetical protein